MCLQKAHHVGYKLVTVKKIQQSDPTNYSNYFYTRISLKIKNEGVKITYDNSKRTLGKQIATVYPLFHACLSNIPRILFGTYMWPATGNVDFVLCYNLCHET